VNYGEAEAGADAGSGPDGANPPQQDGGSDSTDAAPDADPDGGETQASAHLLLTEVTLTPAGSEFIEIANLTGAPVSLSDYYLSDTNQYMFTAGAAGAGPAPSVGSSDFIARFPFDAALADGEVAVIAIDGDGFETAFGFSADYCLVGASCTPLLHISVGGSATLTNSGEPIVLFYWDGSTDLVLDEDIVKTGSLGGSNPMADKSSVVVDGPDGDGTAASYAADLADMPSPSSAPVSGESIKRIALEGVSEEAGGNGHHGHDETSENIQVTWDAVGPYDAPTPGTLPLSLAP